MTNRLTDISLENFLRTLIGQAVQGIIRNEINDELVYLLKWTAQAGERTVSHLRQLINNMLRAAGSHYHLETSFIFNPDGRFEQGYVVIVDHKNRLVDRALKLSRTSGRQSIYPHIVPLTA